MDANGANPLLTFGTMTAARSSRRQHAGFSSTAVNPAEPIEPRSRRTGNLQHWTLDLKTNQLKQYRRAVRQRLRWCSGLTVSRRRS
jgi:hypothetical protein